MSAFCVLIGIVVATAFWLAVWDYCVKHKPSPIKKMRGKQRAKLLLWVPTIKRELRAAVAAMEQPDPVGNGPKIVPAALFTLAEGCLATREHPSYSAERVDDDDYEFLNEFRGIDKGLKNVDPDLLAQILGAMRRLLTTCGVDDIEDVTKPYAQKLAAMQGTE